MESSIHHVCIMSCRQLILIRIHVYSCNYGKELNVTCCKCTSATRSFSDSGIDCQEAGVAKIHSVFPIGKKSTLEEDNRRLHWDFYHGMTIPLQWSLKIRSHFHVRVYSNCGDVGVGAMSRPMKIGRRRGPMMLGMLYLRRGLGWLLRRHLHRCVHVSSLEAPR